MQRDDLRLVKMASILLLIKKSFIPKAVHEDLIWGRGGGSVVQWLAYFLLDSAAPGSIPSILKKISEEKIDIVAEVYQQRCLEESEQ